MSDFLIEEHHCSESDTMQFCVSAILFVTGAVLVRSASLPEEAQSPIDIDNFKERTCPKLVYKKCNNNALAKLENTGHTVRITTKGTQPLLTGGPLKSDYTFHDVHFHWGKSNREGSEHTKRGSQYPMEAHVVHYKTKYDSFSKASEKKDGLAIIGIFFDISTSNNSQRSDKDSDNEQLKPLVALLRDVAKAQERVENSASFLLQWLWPHITPSNYYTYRGSLTTPPYSEVATWIVYDTPIQLSENQIAAFQELVPEGNFRKTQPLNGRKLTFCKPNNKNIFDY